MSIKLSAPQTKFMTALQEGTTTYRDISNATGKSLARKGLVKFVVMVGWVLTPEGATIKLGGGCE